MHLLQKGIAEFQALLNQTKAVNLSTKDAAIFKTIKTVYQQQKHHFDHPKAKIPDRIVSLYKPYIRPIVRGKENKSVEFGIKVHKLQVGGISLIEHRSYKAFNECKRLKISVLKHKKIFGKCTHIAGVMRPTKIGNIVPKKRFRQIFVGRAQAKMTNRPSKSKGC